MSSPQRVLIGGVWRPLMVGGSPAKGCCCEDGCYCASHEDEFAGTYTLTMPESINACHPSGYEIYRDDLTAILSRDAACVWSGSCIAGIPDGMGGWAAGSLSFTLSGFASGGGCSWLLGIDGFCTIDIDGDPDETTPVGTYGGISIS